MTSPASARSTGTLSFPSFQRYYTTWQSMPGIALTPVPDQLRDCLSLGTVPPLMPPAPLWSSIRSLVLPPRPSDSASLAAHRLFAESAVAALAAQAALHIALGRHEDLLTSPDAFHHYVRQELSRAIPEPVLARATHAPQVPPLIRTHLAALAALTSYPDQVAYVTRQREAAYDRYYHRLTHATPHTTPADRIHAFTVAYTRHLQSVAPKLDHWFARLTPSTSLAIVGPAQSDATFCPRLVVARWLSQELPARWARQLLPIGMIRYFVERLGPGRLLAEVQRGCARLGRPLPSVSSAALLPHDLVRQTIDPQVLWQALPTEIRQRVPRPRLVLDDLSASLTGDDLGEDTTTRSASHDARPVSVPHDLPLPTPSFAKPLPPRLAIPETTLACFPFLAPLVKRGDPFSALSHALATRGVRSLDALSLAEQAQLLADVYPAHADSCRAFAADLAAQTRTFAPEEFGTDFGAIAETRELSPFWMDLESGCHAVISEEDPDGGELVETGANGVDLQIVELDAANDPEPQPSFAFSPEEQAALQQALATKGLTDPNALTTIEWLDLILETLPNAAPQVSAFRAEYDAWQARDRARSRSLSLDLLQERLNAPSTRATRFGRHHSRCLQLLVTEALRAPRAPHPTLVLAGMLLPSQPIADLDHPVAVASWISTMAADPDRFRELTIDPEAPATRATLGLTHEAVLPSAELAKLASDLEVALVREAREALWASDEAALHPKLVAATERLARDRGLDPSTLVTVVSDTIVPRWRRNNVLYSALALAFITGRDTRRDGHSVWTTRIRHDGRAAWILPWLKTVAAVAFTVQRASHWKARALQWGGLTPADAEAHVRHLPDFEREFIRVRLHSAFGFMHERFGDRRITPTMPLGTAVRRSRQLAGHIHAAA
jgi:hypothetical protein